MFEEAIIIGQKVWLGETTTTQLPNKLPTNSSVTIDPFIKKSKGKQPQIAQDPKKLPSHNLSNLPNASTSQHNYAPMPHNNLYTISHVPQMPPENPSTIPSFPFKPSY